MVVRQGRTGVKNRIVLDVLRMTSVSPPYMG